MDSNLIQIIVLAGVALFLILRLRSVLGTRDGFERPSAPPTAARDNARDHAFEVIDGGGQDQDISDYTDPDSDAGKALTEMKRVDPEFSVGDFMHGARAAYEMILMAYERGELDTLEQFLSPEVYEGFAAAVFARADQGLTVDASFVGIREIKLIDAHYSTDEKEADITVRFVGELTSSVKNAAGDIVEGDPTEVKRQRDVWTFSRSMQSDDPNWRLVATGE